MIRNMRKTSILILCSILFSLSACNEEHPDLQEGMYAEFVTNKGTFIAELFYKATPMTVASFVSLAEGTSEMAEEQYRGEPFYDGLTFHRVIEDFMIQGGDPEGTGTGGPGYKFPNEIVDTLQHDSKGILSMANSGPDTNGSQFFITLKETPWLDGMHTVFGEVVQGMDVIDSIGAVETGPQDRPVEEIVMNEVNIIRKGSDAKDFNASEVLNRELEEFQAEAEAEEQRMAEQSEANAQRFEEMKAEAEELESGVQIYFNEEGDGEKPDQGDTVLVEYAGYFADGKLFDTSIEEVAKEYGVFDPRRKEMNGYQPIAAQYGPDPRMIPGFGEGLQQMRVGDKATIFIPSHQAYGEQGRAPLIPPDTDLVFELKLVDIQE